MSRTSRGHFSDRFQLTRLSRGEVGKGSLGHKKRSEWYTLFQEKFSGFPWGEIPLKFPGIYRK